MKHLGKLEKINPRQIWADEARDFTPWLRENIRGFRRFWALTWRLSNRKVALAASGSTWLAGTLARDAPW